MLFDVDDPPTTYRKFRRVILRLLEETEMETDEEYPVCLFLVSRQNEGDIIYPEEIAEELGLDEEFPMTPIIHSLFPTRTAEFNSKFFAIVFQGTYETEAEEEVDILIVLSGSGPSSDDPSGAIDFLRAEIVEEDNELQLEPWQKMSSDTFPDLVIPFRRSVCPQG
jgi:hypothetical protein